VCDGTIRIKDLPTRVCDYQPKHPEQSDPGLPAADLTAREEWPLLSEVEARYVTRVLTRTGGNKQAASRIIGVDRKTLDRMIKRHSISVPK